MYTITKIYKEKNARKKQKLFLDMLSGFSKCKKRQRPKTEEECNIDCGYAKYIAEFDWKETTKYLDEPIEVDGVKISKISFPSYIVLYDLKTKEFLKEISLEDVMEDVIDTTRKYIKIGLEF